METNKRTKKVKEFDAVKMMREIRDKINLETKDMTFEELRKYIDSKLKNKARLIGQ
jgi:parvulin-like peptidyl-prolyl isomerase